jgi:hypothetical protein
VSVEDAFATLLGRQASDRERERLHRVRDALHLGDNDALWLIVLALEHYDALFREYPESLGQVTRHALEQAQAAFATAAEAEAAKAHRVLAERVADASLRIARTLAERPFPWTPCLLGGLWLVLFGAMSLTAGYELADPARPFWADPTSSTGARALLAVVLGAPAGWMVFAGMLAIATRAAHRGWSMAHDPESGGRERAWGWGIAAMAGIGVVACASILAKVLSR